MAELPNRLQVGTSFEQAIPLLNRMMDELDNENRTKIIFNGSVPQILFGYQKAGFTDVNGNLADYGLKISRIDPANGVPFDVTKAIDEQLQFTTAVDTRLMYNQHIPQLLFGYQAGGFAGQSYGLKVSKINPGTALPYDVRTATDEQLAFSTGFAAVQVLKSGTVSFPMIGVGASGSVAIPHGLDYPPMALVTVKMFHDDAIIGDFFDPVPLNIADNLFSGWSVDDTNLYLYAASSVSVEWPYPEATLRYYIVRQTADAA